MKIYPGHKEKFYLTLQEVGGGVRLVAVDEDGHTISTLLFITEEGALGLCYGVNAHLGLSLDKNNMLKVQEVFE